ncbi:hypothetical protein ACGH2B_01565 [Streptomyces sp. BBFR2]|uniref:hypothetical protein n=1 Tax=Streptomyces sp. BBFR2 TaxID=3372854 RepID=UPI0037D9F2C2
MSTGAPQLRAKRSHGAPEAAAAEAGLWARELSEPPLRGRVALAWRADGSPGPAVRILLERLQTALTRVAPDPPHSP